MVYLSWEVPEKEVAAAFKNSAGLAGDASLITIKHDTESQVLLFVFEIGEDDGKLFEECHGEEFIN